MIKEVRLPEISENVESGDVIKVLVAVGDTIAVDQPIVELETEKAVLEIPSPYAGKVTEVLVKVGDTINIEQVIIKVDTDARAQATAETKPKAAPSLPAASKPQKALAAPSRGYAGNPRKPPPSRTF